MNQALIILGDQLFPPSFYLPHKDKFVFMAEDLDLATHYMYHKHKIAFFFASMRTYADELKAKKFNVYYEELSGQDFFKRLLAFVKKKQIQKIVVAEIQDKFFETKVMEFCEGNNLELEVLDVLTAGI